MAYTTPTAVLGGCPMGHTSARKRPSERLSDFIEDANFPCVGAKSALKKDRIRFARYETFGDDDSAADLCERLDAFSAEFPEPGNLPVSFIAMFEQHVPDEATLERLLWAHLQKMHEHDRQTFEWDARVGSDPSLNDFSMSIGGRAYFVVGLHPQASRMARRAPFPCLVFNFHDQFEHLKATGKYQSMQEAIRARDVKLQGSINPVLARFGEASEARQYSGRAVEAEWRCPFHRKEN